MPLDDLEDRRRAIGERARNVIVDASAGTGKTTLIVDRLLELVAPHGDAEPIPLGRLAAITFTRKAAGELRVRTRQRLLAELAAAATDERRTGLLRDALGAVDTAHIGTIHGFADRLLRRFPAQARLDPHYQLQDDASELVRSCVEQLVHGAETGGLSDLVAGSPAAERAAEAAAAILDAQRAGLRVRSREAGHWCYHGLDALIEGFIEQRDVDPPEPDLAGLDRPAFDRYADEMLRWTEGLAPTSRGARWLLEVAARLRALATEHDPAVLFRELVDRVQRGPLGKPSDSPQLRRDFGGDQAVWNTWKAFDGDGRKHPVRDRPLRDDLLAPLRRWLAVCLLRIRPVALELYERIKARHQVVDHVDLLLRLRALLRDDRAIRGACQRVYDHVFVDEFQDTDPLQAEILLFLAEDGVDAPSWDRVRVAPGRLTLVGDPKQSIYRFRRADIATYQQVMQLVERSPHLTARLTSSFRSTPALVGWLGDCFDHILGTAADGARYDAATGTVFHQRLTIGRASGEGPAVHVVPFDLGERGDAAACRAIEAEGVARYLRWLVHHSGATIEGPSSRRTRAIGYGDIAVLAMTTTELPTLFAAFDRDGVPYAARGGALFLRDPLHRRFLLGLCALADRDDGVANAALFRPPFFAIGPGELARVQVDDPEDPVVRARGIVRALRALRFVRGPGATARALLEHTGAGRTIALGPNGEQRLAGLRELCFQLELHAASERLDFDEAMALLRGWLEQPVGLDPPLPIGGAAVRVLTIHQAKGLEFPIVVLWDTRASWLERRRHEAWTVERAGAGWAMSVDPLVWSEPAGVDLAARERDMCEAERKRLVYVAATRARDLLVLPTVGPASSRWIGSTLATTAPGTAVREQARHSVEAPAPWFVEAAPSSAVAISEITAVDRERTALWRTRAGQAARPRARPVAFTNAASPRMFWGRKGRHGPVFGDTVHAAIAVVAAAGGPVDAAVRTAAARAGLTAHLEAAADDVARALATLHELGLLETGVTRRFEYPIAGLDAAGDLVAGYVDLVATRGGKLVVLDFKTDAPPSDGEPIPAAYVSQVAGYAATLAHALSRDAVQAGLLFTADGQVRWVTP